MTYRLGGVEVYPPATGAWRPRRPLGISGEGRPVYAGPYEFEIRYDFISIEEFDKIHDVWKTVQSTGTLVAELPDILQSLYAFREFSGCHMEEPQVSRYFEEYYSDVLILVRNINP